MPPTETEEPDEQLMSRAAHGDLAAFGLLVERHHPRALNLAYRLTGNAETAKDAAQESFLRILGAARRYEPRGRFTTYLFAVVRNTARELARRERRRREEPLATGEEGDPSRSAPLAAPADPPEPERVAGRRELRERLLGALRALPEELRAAFVLSELEGLSYREVAQVCGCPAGTVASRKHAAVTRLRALLEPLRSGS
jgi:RNA polymerase sigma-70 factor (ECF subfamily)